MKNVLVLIAFLTLVSQNYAQKYYTKTGTLNFEGSVKAFEPVKASNKNTTAVFDTSTGNIAVLALVKGFRFKNALMEEHFNENYMDSNTYPKATFKGMIKGFSISDDLSLKKEYEVEGTITIHGTTKPIKTTIALVNKGDFIVLDTNFEVSPKDFKIDIPSIVREKISESISISGTFKLTEK